MNISSFNAVTKQSSYLSSTPVQKNSSDKKPSNPFWRYAGAEAIGGIIGYNISLKPVEHESISEGNRMCMKIKNTVPNPNRWRNALIGIIIGTLLTGIYDYFKSSSNGVEKV